MIYIGILEVCTAGVIIAAVIVAIVRDWRRRK